MRALITIGEGVVDLMMGHLTQSTMVASHPINPVGACWQLAKPLIVCKMKIA